MGMFDKTPEDEAKIREDTFAIVSLLGTPKVAITIVAIVAVGAIATIVLSLMGIV